MSSSKLGNAVYFKRFATFRLHIFHQEFCNEIKNFKHLKLSPITFMSFNKSAV